MSTASKTARMVAHFRGRASEVHREISSDPWALVLGGEDGAAYAQEYEAAHPHMVLYMAIRTAFFDDAVRAGIADGVRQVVALGAGFDTRAARLAASGTRFFEVDRLESQRDKRARVATLAGYDAGSVTYVTCDFENDDFLDRLIASGFDPAASAVFVWEGVTYYLEEATVRGTLARIASACEPTTRICFDTIGKRFARGDLRDRAEIRVREIVAEMGEPIRFGVDDVVPLAFDAGYRYVRSITCDALALALNGTYERDRKMRFQSMHELRVMPPARPR